MYAFKYAHIHVLSAAVPWYFILLPIIKVSSTNRITYNVCNPDISSSRDLLDFVIGFLPLTLIQVSNSHSGNTKESPGKSNHPRKEGSSQAQGKKAFNRTLPLPQDQTATRSRRTKVDRQVVPVEHHAVVPVEHHAVVPVGCDPADIAQAMQHMVRTELRKIFQVRLSFCHLYESSSE